MDLGRTDQIHVLYRVTKTSIYPQLNSPAAQIRTNQTRSFQLVTVACWLLSSWGGQLRFCAPGTLGQTDDTFLGGPGGMISLKSFEIWFSQMAFPAF